MFGSPDPSFILEPHWECCFFGRPNEDADPLAIDKLW